MRFDLRNIFKGEVLENEPLARHTSLKVGGPADWFVSPADLEDLEKLLRLCSENSAPWMIIGGGFNLLALDGGFRGVVISLRHLEAIERMPGDRVKVEAGASNLELVRFCRKESLTGLEFLGMVPGTLGGALAVNAGAYGSSIMEKVEGLTTLIKGELREWDVKEREFDYRSHKLADNEVILSAEFALMPGEIEAIDRMMEQYREHRSKSQNVGFPNAGSFFKNPPETQAWRLIEAAGLKGTRIGGAQVSEIHSNFLVNRGNATAKDFCDLALMIKERVKDSCGVELEEEVRIVGVEDK